MFKNHSRILTSSLLFSLFSFYSCYYDNAQDLYGLAPCDTTGVTYNLTVDPILATHCYSCHSQTTSSNGGGKILTPYDRLLPYVTNGKLIGSMNHASGFSPMPKNASKLNSCDIQKIQAWVDAGAKP